MVAAGFAVAFFNAAPRAHLQFHHHTNMTSGLALQNDEIDCAVGMFPRPPTGLNVMPLMTDEYVCVLREGHPLSKGTLTLEGFTAASHVLAKPSGIGSDTIDYWLALHGLNRHISPVVAHFADAMRISAVSGLLSCVPVRHLRHDAVTQLGLAIHPLPFETEKILFKLVWHERTERSASHQWLRKLVVEQLSRGEHHE
ncbi:LysR substrate-binding domain-containing protein [Rhizobium binxianense]